jgi:hypothetical protein
MRMKIMVSWNFSTREQKARDAWGQYDSQGASMSHDFRSGFHRGYLETIRTIEPEINNIGEVLWMRDSNEWTTVETMIARFLMRYPQGAA